MPPKANVAARSFLNLSESQKPCVHLAPTARRSTKAWGNAPGLWDAKNASAEGAIQWIKPGIEARFQRFRLTRFASCGDAAG